MGEPRLSLRWSPAPCRPRLLITEASPTALLRSRGSNSGASAIGLLSHKLSDCRHQTEVSDRFFEKPPGPSVASAPLVGKTIESG